METILEKVHVFSPDEDYGSQFLHESENHEDVYVIHRHDHENEYEIHYFLISKKLVYPNKLTLNQLQIQKPLKSVRNNQ